MNDIAQIIASLGFPIAMCVALCWYIYKVQTPLTAALVKFTERVDSLLDRLEEEKKPPEKSGRKEG